MPRLHTAAALRDLQKRYTAARVFIVGLEVGAEESMLEISAPLNPTYEPCVPFGIKTVPTPTHSQPCRWIRVCGLYFLALTTVVESLSKITKLEVLEIGEEPGPDAVMSPVPSSAPSCQVPGCERFNGHQSFHTTSPAIAKKEDSIPRFTRAVCGCGAVTCPHGHCSESCDGFPCGDCGNTRSADK